ncbi:MAG: hypothetical protein CME70_05330 [Halobacteriovorax sp.]|nr:hypothetical protein [Halobacteriovorax sp.]|tara:strand:+ start:67745 stop:68776 length:1032 start_codon:yes stop_codon:yes gene_type:complete
MENYLKYLLAIAFFSFCFAGLSEAAVKKTNPHKNLRQHKNELASISKQIYSLESNLGKGNKRYLKTLDQRKKLEELIVKLDNEIKSDQKLNEEKKVETRKRLKQVLVQGFGKVSTPAQVLSRKLVLNLLKKELAELNRIHKKRAKLIKSMEISKAKYEDLRRVESDLLSLMNEMEESKREKSLRYVKLKEEKEKLRKKLKFNKAKSLAKRKKTKLISERFSTPLTDFIDMEYAKKGVTYKFNSRQAVRTSRAGKIIHTGSLSTYGNVVMVDHGNEVKSIYLGQFLPSVKKGQSVNAGESLGKTFDVAKNEGKLYFEVRKKNKAQNTILLLDKNTTKNNNRRRM